MAYDLPLTGGRVIDPAQGIDIIGDIAFENGRKCLGVARHVAGERLTTDKRLSCAGIIIGGRWWADGSI